MIATANKPTGSRAAREETWHDVKNLVYQTAHQFVARYGGDRDEWLAEARLGYCIAYDTYTPDRAAFTTWVRNAVWFHLAEVARKQRGLRRKVRRYEQQFASSSEEGLTANDVPDRATGRFDRRGFLANLSDDARTVAELVFAPDAELLPAADNGSGGGWRRGLRGYLAGLGWTAARIAESFGEIAVVLGS